MHGTSSSHFSSLFTGIDPTLGTGDLGPGFYTTPQQPVAEYFAHRAVGAYGGKAAILGVQVKGFTTGDNPMVGIFVPLGTKITADMIANYDYLYGPVSSFPGAFQVKFNPRVAHRLRVIPLPATPPDPAKPKDRKYRWDEIK
jgi:hypothetical protein